ncbi:MAG: C40 family peptidase [Candidatus Eremiobacteraeota bacterium]|nr:C40 family peptidase [Candidatus Eremiobacteraeota bacterium]
MRFSLAAGLFCILISGSSLVAQAADTTSPAQPSGAAVAAQAVADADSPDVAAWTSTASVAEAARPAEAAETPHARSLSKFAARILSRTAGVAKGLTQGALRFLGVPYAFGGTSAGGFDCSGYVQHVFALVGLHIPRTADAQYYAGVRVTGGMVPGDLVFFQTYEPGPSHVGIYLGKGRFAHASSSHGVMVSSLSDSYWSARYIGAKRLASR